MVNYRKRRRKGGSSLPMVIAVLAIALLWGYGYFSAEGTENAPISSGSSSETVELPSAGAGSGSLLGGIPEWDGNNASVEVNGNVPYFTEGELTTEAFQSYSDLDSLGRCGTAFMCAGPETLPDADRGEIGQVKPTGWHTVKYGCIDGLYLYNRCHLCAFCLSGQNANEKNLVTGTRYMNVEGMLPYEEETVRYIEDSGNHVMYRVTPVFSGDDLVCRGVLMEAYSVEDSGGGISFCVFCYNVQPGIKIDYATGESTEAE